MISFLGLKRGQILTCFLLSLLGAYVLFLAFIPGATWRVFAPSYFVELKIENCGAINKKSRGSEVWVHSIDQKGAGAVLTEREHWKTVRNQVASLGKSSKELRWSGYVSSHEFLTLGKHPWSGGCVITINGEKTIEDLYSPEPSTLSYTLVGHLPVNSLYRQISGGVYFLAFISIFFAFFTAFMFVFKGDCESSASYRESVFLTLALLVVFYLVLNISTLFPFLINEGFEAFELLHLSSLFEFPDAHFYPPYLYSLRMGRYLFTELLMNFTGVDAFNGSVLLCVLSLGLFYYYGARFVNDVSGKQFKLLALFSLFLFPCLISSAFYPNSQIMVLAPLAIGLFLITGELTCRKMLLSGLMFGMACHIRVDSCVVPFASCSLFLFSKDRKLAVSIKYLCLLACFTAFFSLLFLYLTDPLFIEKLLEIFTAQKKAYFNINPYLSFLKFLTFPALFVLMLGLIDSFRTSRYDLAVFALIGAGSTIILYGGQLVTFRFLVPIVITLAPLALLGLDLLFKSFFNTRLLPIVLLTALTAVGVIRSNEVANKVVTDEGVLDTWRGFGVAPGEIHRYKDSLVVKQRFLDRFIRSFAETDKAKDVVIISTYWPTSSYINYKLYHKFEPIEVPQVIVKSTNFQGKSYAYKDMATGRKIILLQTRLGFTSPPEMLSSDFIKLSALANNYDACIILREPFVKMLHNDFVALGYKPFGVARIEHTAVYSNLRDFRLR